MSLDVGTALPEFQGVTSWLNVNASSYPTPNTPLLIHVWAMSCPSCHANMPPLQELRDKYAPQSLQVIAIYRPRGPLDMNVEKVRESAEELGVTEPCAIDNEHMLGDYLQVDAWPTYFLFDAEHRLRRHARGNFGVNTMRSALERLSGE